MDLHQSLSQKLLRSFWKKIQKFSHLSIHTQSMHEQPPKENKGKALVEIKKLEEHQLLFKEKGVWDKSEISFTNVWRWTLFLEKAYVQLEHLRRGEKHPVHLVNLKILEKDHLICDKPHPCSEDRYYGECYLKGKKLHLMWKVLGPETHDEIHGIYS